MKVVTRRMSILPVVGLAALATPLLLLSALWVATNGQPEVQGNNACYEQLKYCWHAEWLYPMYCQNGDGSNDEAHNDANDLCRQACGGIQCNVVFNDTSC